MSEDHTIDAEVPSDLDFGTLMAEAQDLGLQYTGNDPVELDALVTMARLEAGDKHPVPCYGKSYDPTDRRCRICQLRKACADLDPSPRVEVLAPDGKPQLEPIPCGACAKGELSVELLDVEARTLRDYGCTTRGCQQTVGIQCGWSTDVSPEIVIEEEKGSEEESEAKAEPVAGPAVPPSAEPVPAPPKPKRKVVVKKGKSTKKKKAAKKATKKVSKKPAAKKAAKKPTAKKAAKKAAKKPTAKKKEAKKTAKPKPKQTSLFGASTNGLKFRLDGGEEYESLTQVAQEITGGRNWSGPKFFKVDHELSPGEVLRRTWKGSEHTVNVLEAK
jgi:hypothetical protein